MAPRAGKPRLVDDVAGGMQVPPCWHGGSQVTHFSHIHPALQVSEPWILQPAAFPHLQSPLSTHSLPPTQYFLWLSSATPQLPCPKNLPAEQEPHDELQDKYEHLHLFASSSALVLLSSKPPFAHVPVFHP